MGIVFCAVVMLLQPLESSLTYELRLPDEWDCTSTGVSRDGGPLICCYWWDGAEDRHRVLILAPGDPVGKVRVDDQRVTGITSICSASDGGFFISCPEYSKSSETAAAKLTPSGEVEWFTDTGIMLVDGCSVVSLADGGFAMGGNRYDDDFGGRYFYMALLDESGVITRELEGDLLQEIRTVTANEDGILIVGRMEGSGETQGFAGLFDLNGGLLWEQGYDQGGFSTLHSASATADGYIFGGTHWPFEGQMSGLLVKTSRSGDELWTALLQPDSGYQQLYLLSVMEEDNGEILASGFTVADNEPRNTDDALLVRLDSDGTEISRLYYGLPGENHESFDHLRRDPNGELVIFCVGWGPDHGTGTYSVLKP